MSYDGPMKRYPRSFLQLITLGQFLVVIPLLVMAGYALFTVHQLSQHYLATTGTISELGRLSGELTEDIQHMEIYLRRHEILGDAESLGDYEHVREEWQGHLSAFAQLQMLPVEMIREAQSLMDVELNAHNALIANGDVAIARSVIDEMRIRTTKLREEVQSLIVQDQQGIKTMAENVFKHTFIALLLATVGTLAIVMLVRRLLSRLLGGFEQAVLALGHGKLQNPILLDGPDDLRWLGRWMDWLRRRLLSLEESRTQVLRHVSHELKTPLAAMREGTSLLSDQVVGKLMPEQEKILEIVRDNVFRLQDLIEGLLNLQMAGHAAERIDFEWLRYDELIEQVTHTHRLIAQERKIRIVLQLAPTRILAGREALLTIVHNLLSNAVKFSPMAGTICIQLSADDAHCTLDVFDQGPGVPEPERHRLAEPFYRGSTSKNLPGAGLGLAIASEFILAHRGNLKVGTAPGGGAHFRVTLPLNAPYLRKGMHE